jgi:hypothetical protein
MRIWADRTSKTINIALFLSLVIYKIFIRNENPFCLI